MRYTGTKLETADTDKRTPTGPPRLPPTRQREYLLALPEHGFQSELVRVVRSGKTPYVSFDRNLYSIPHALRR